MPILSVESINSDKEILALTTRMDAMENAGVCVCSPEAFAAMFPGAVAGAWADQTRHIEGVVVHFQVPVHPAL